MCGVQCWEGWNGRVGRIEGSIGAQSHGEACTWAQVCGKATLTPNSGGYLNRVPVTDSAPVWYDPETVHLCGKTRKLVACGQCLPALGLFSHLQDGLSLTFPFNWT